MAKIVKKSKNIAVYAGTFDPITNGHMDILYRGLQVFDIVYLAIAKGGPRVSTKLSYFSINERLKLARGAVSEFKLDKDRVIVESFDGMLVDYASKLGARVIIRGLRAVSDYEYETQLAHTNRLLNSEIETVFLVTSEPNSFISSSIIRNVALNGGDISKMVPKVVKKYFTEKLNGKV
jgi:pantetheine-phosphate adenylyltransferase